MNMNTLKTKLSYPVSESPLSSFWGGLGTPDSNSTGGTFGRRVYFFHGGLRHGGSAVLESKLPRPTTLLESH